jgi:aerobic-type carbon monoxide dehydrogenase small subunit (CoxS/CutS family)
LIEALPMSSSLPGRTGPSVEQHAFTLNGAPVQLRCDGEKPLLLVLRNHFGLRGARFGCGEEQCGACTVLIDGEPSFSCSRRIDTVAGRDITTVEGLAETAPMRRLREAFLEGQAGQCGYCLSGILVAAAALLAANPSPTRGEIAAALDPHLCRCGIHNRILSAVEHAAARGDASV